MFMMSLMPKRDGIFERYPTSRDFDLPVIPCKILDCPCNSAGKCEMPSAIVINAAGVCEMSTKTANWKESV